MLAILTRAVETLVIIPQFFQSSLWDIIIL